MKRLQFFLCFALCAAAGCGYQGELRLPEASERPAQQLSPTTD